MKAQAKPSNAFAPLSAICLLITVLLTVMQASAFVQNQNSPPVSKEALLTAIRLKRQTPADLIQEVQKRGISFQMTPAVETELRTAGAPPGLLGMAYAKQGEVHNQAGRFQAGADSFQQVIRLVPNYFFGYYGLGISQSALKRYKLAVKSFEEAIRLKPDYSYAFRGLGDAYLNLGQYQDAVTSYKQSLLFNQNDAFTYFYLGIAYRNFGQFSDAVEASQQSIRLKPDFAEAYLSLSLAQDALDQHSAALASAKQAIRLKPGVADSYTTLGSIYSELGQYDDAIAAGKQAVLLKPDDGLAYSNLSWYYSFAGQAQASVDAGRQAVQYMPEYYMGYTNLCRAYIDVAKYQDALAVCERSLQLKPGDGETNLYLGRVYRELKQPTKSAAAFRQAVDGFKSAPQHNADYFYLLGSAYFEINQLKEAVEAYQEAVKLKPNFAQAHLNLGVAQFVAGNKRAALAEHATLKSLDPDRAARLLKLINGQR